jgi:hypothetical protein
MLSDVAKLAPFKDATRGEDLDWTLSLYRTGVLKTEYRTDPSRTHYIYNLGNRLVTPDVVRRQQEMSYEALLAAVWLPGAQSSQPSPSPTGPRVLRLGTRGFVSK